MCQVPEAEVFGSSSNLGKGTVEMEAWINAHSHFQKLKELRHHPYHLRHHGC